jgi:hypothetical protein
VGCEHLLWTDLQERRESRSELVQIERVSQRIFRRQRDPLAELMGVPANRSEFAVAVVDDLAGTFAVTRVTRARIPVAENVGGTQVGLDDRKVVAAEMLPPGRNIQESGDTLKRTPEPGKARTRGRAGSEAGP